MSDILYRIGREQICSVHVWGRGRRYTVSVRVKGFRIRGRAAELIAQCGDLDWALPIHPSLGVGVVLADVRARLKTALREGSFLELLDGPADGDAREAHPSMLAFVGHID